MTVRDLWSQLLADYALSAGPWLAEELSTATVSAALVDGATTITAATRSLWLPWLRKQLAPGASRKASIIAGRAVKVEFVEATEGTQAVK